MNIDSLLSQNTVRGYKLVRRAVLSARALYKKEQYGIKLCNNDEALVWAVRRKIR